MYGVFKLLNILYKKSMEEIERLENEVIEMNDYNVLTIFNYLKSRNDLYEKFNNKEKSIKEMYKFICDKAKKQAKNNVAMISDKVVYLWAITYFNKSNEELGLIEQKIIKSNDSQIKKNESKIEEKKLKDNQITLFQEVQN